MPGFFARFALALRGRKFASARQISLESAFGFLNESNGPTGRSFSLLTVARGRSAPRGPGPARRDIALDKPSAATGRPGRFISMPWLTPGGWNLWRGPLRKGPRERLRHRAPAAHIGRPVCGKQALFPVIAYGCHRHRGRLPRPRGW